MTSTGFRRTYVSVQFKGSSQPEAAWQTRRLWAHPQLLRKNPYEQEPQATPCTSAFKERRSRFPSPALAPSPTTDTQGWLCPFLIAGPHFFPGAGLAGISTTAAGRTLWDSPRARTQAEHKARATLLVHLQSGWRSSNTGASHRKPPLRRLR